jgi:hypothetical protein
MKISKKIILGILPVLAISLSLNTSAQQSIQVSLGSINRPTPQFGFNAVGHIPSNFPVGSSGANWTQQSFIDSTIYLYPEILRFPGGTNTNHWDWQLGWYKPGYEPPSPALTIRAEEFKPGLIGCDATGLFVVNIETSTAQYEMDGLRHAADLGLNPTLFEIGNEHNLPSNVHPLQEMSSTAYGQLAKEYYDSIKLIFPNSKVSAVGGNTPNHPTWNADVLTAIPTIDALTFHVYLVADNADLAFNVNRALAIPFGSVTDNRTLPFRFDVGGFSSSSVTGSSSLPAGKEVWVTEFNLQENQIASTPVIAATWTHLLYVTAMNDFFLSQPNVTMILNHALASVEFHYESISKADQHIAANGIAMKLILDVARGSTSCENLSFAGNPSMTYDAVTIPKLIGWKFDHGDSKKGFICNFSKDSFTLSLEDVLDGDMDFTTYSADTTLVVSGLSSLNKQSGNSTNNITIPPFSITQITSTPSAITLGFKETSNSTILIYPNPSNGLVTIDFFQWVSDAEIRVFDLNGREVLHFQNLKGQKVEINTSALLSGTYFMKILNENVMTSRKLIIE